MAAALPLEGFYLHRAARCAFRSQHHHTCRGVRSPGHCTGTSRTHTGPCRCTLGPCRSHPGTWLLRPPAPLACTHTAGRHGPPGSYKSKDSTWVGWVTVAEPDSSGPLSLVFSTPSPRSLANRPLPHQLVCPQPAPTACLLFIFQPVQKVLWLQCWVSLALASPTIWDSLYQRDKGHQPRLKPSCLLALK